MKPEALPDMVMGKADAPVTIIEYASMTCPHCAHFQETTFPALKTQYIDTGKVRYIFREFPLDNLAAAAFMLARCAGKDNSSKYFAMIETMFKQQRTWAVEKPIPPMMAIAKQAGFTQDSVQRLPGESADPRRHREGAPARHQRFQGRIDADVLRQRHQGDRRLVHRGNGQGHRSHAEEGLSGPILLRRDRISPQSLPKSRENRLSRPLFLLPGRRGLFILRPATTRGRHAQPAPNLLMRCLKASKVQTP